MKEKLPRVTASDVVKVLEKAGFFLARQKGVTEYEIYKRYLRNNPRHYQKVSD